VHRTVEESFETLRECLLRAWLHAKKKGKNFDRIAVVL
jgi:hypothetical protein